MIRLFEIPAHWSIDWLDHIQSTTDSFFDLKVYGAIPNLFPTGRPNDFGFVDFIKVKEYFAYAKSQGILTNYLLNGNPSDLQVEKYRKTYDTLVRDIKPDFITVSNLAVFNHLISLKYYNIEISAIAGVLCLKDLEDLQFDLNHVKSLVLHHSFAKGLDDPGYRFIESLFKKDIEPIVLVTESCFFKCPFRQQHYRFIGIPQHGMFIDPYQIFCINKRLINPDSLIDLAGFLLPEQMPEFQIKTSIRSFKISGRSMSPEWILNTTKAYLSGQSPENLFEIIVFTSPFLEEFGMKIQDLFYLDSKAYNEIYYELIEQTTPKLRQSFLKKKAAELFLAGKLKINDPNSQYDVINGELKLIKKGDYLKRLETELDKFLILNNMHKLKAAFEKSYERTY